MYEKSESKIGERVMAKQLTEDKVKMGYLLPVENLEKKPNENESYLAVKLENQTGEDEVWMLFSEKEISSRQTLELPDMDEPKLGRAFRVGIGKRMYSAFALISCKDLENWKKGEKKILLFSCRVLDRAKTRAKKNPEDIPTQSFLSDLLD